MKKHFIANRTVYEKEQFNVKRQFLADAKAVFQETGTKIWRYATIYYMEWQFSEAKGHFFQIQKTRFRHGVSAINRIA